jgi:hypothetical protein
MKYWEEDDDSHIRFGDTDLYRVRGSLDGKLSSEGYLCEKLQKSNVLYLGSCDVMSSMTDKDKRWSVLLHKELHADQPFIALGTIGSGFPSMVRRLHSFVKNHGAPKIVYMTIPRFDGYEYVNKSGKCYNVSSRVGSARFSLKTGLVDHIEHNTWQIQLSANRQLNNPNNTQYILEERFSFIELLCRAYNTELKWTFNPSDASIVVLKENLQAFEHISEFMKQSFVGLPVIQDQLPDRSIGFGTHWEIYKKFTTNKESWDYEKFCEVAEKNYSWMKDKYGDSMINAEE